MPDLALDVLRIEEQLASHDRQLEHLLGRTASLKSAFADFHLQFAPKLAALQGAVDRLSKPLPDVRPHRSNSTIPESTKRPPKTAPPERQDRQMEFPLNPDHKLDGILAFLTRECGGNVHDQGIVRITSKSVGQGVSEAKNVADLNDFGSFFFSEDRPQEWVCWDFGDLRVRPTNYAIHSSLLKSWNLATSQDGTAWEVIDSQTDRDDFKDYGNTVTYNIEPRPKKGFLNSLRRGPQLRDGARFVRLTQTHHNRSTGNDKHVLSFRAFELFGTLVFE
jgi:hypothetical protein